MRTGIATKIHGVAVLDSNNTEIRPLVEKELDHGELKETIALTAQSFIMGDMVLMVDASYTSKTVIEHTNPRLNFTIITNSYTIINELSGRHNIKFIATGGECYGKYRTFVGTDALNTICRYNVDMALISCHALSLERCFMDSNQLESDVKIAMATQAQHTVMLADHTKFDHISLVNSLSFFDVETLVTDCERGPAWQAMCEKQHLKLLYPAPKMAKLDQELEQRRYEA